MNFRDMGPFENLPYTHVNIGFYRSDPPPGTVALLWLGKPVFFERLSDFHMSLVQEIEATRCQPLTRAEAIGEALPSLRN